MWGEGKSSVNFYVSALLLERKRFTLRACFLSELIDERLMMNEINTPFVTSADEQKAEARMLWSAPCLRHYPMGTSTNANITYSNNDGTPTAGNS